jgi:3-oxoadipate enol-lactonase
MQFARLNGVTLHYEVTGDVARQPALVFANSLGSDLRIWRAVSDRLAGEFALLAYDLRGHGLSDLGPTPFGIADHAADLAALIGHVGLRRAVVCGVSAGGQVALALAAARPDLVEALVLCDTAAVIGTPAYWDTRIANIEAGGLEAVADAVLERWFTSAFRRPDNPAYAGYRNMFVRQSAAGYIATARAVRDADLVAAARGLAVPTLCLAGEADTSTPPALVAALAELIPGARFELIKGAGHLPCIEQPAIFCDTVRAFLALPATEMTNVSH